MLVEEQSQVTARDEYLRRLAAAEEDYLQQDQRDDRFANWRLILAALAIAMVYYCYTGVLNLGLLVLPGALFVALVVLHRRVRARRRAAEQKRELYEQGIARLQDNWPGTGPTGDNYLDEAHEYCADLDLFGDGSLFQLINSARTRLGQDRLADWLRRAAPRDTILERQGGVARLRDEVDLRESLALLTDTNATNGTAHDEFNSSLLLHWAAQPTQSIGQGARLAALGIAACGVVAVAGAIGLDWGWLPVLILFAFALIFQLGFKTKILATMDGMNEAGKGLDTLSQVLEVMQQQIFDDAWLDRIVSGVRFDGVPPSEQVARLAKRVAYLNDSTRNQLFIPVGILLCLPLQLAHALDVWRASVGRDIPKWLAAVADFEATLSLSRLAYERPAYPFPTIVAQGPVLTANALGHPLLNSADCVVNDVRLDGRQQMLMVSGSNMSGKSTLLRSVGVNCVLAQMGAPVCAQAMTLSPFQVATAMRVSDSLQQGQSLFFAVLSRLKRVVDLTDGDTVLFLLDEILQGTNSHDRRIGAEAVIRSLLDRGALGIVTTHDLSLTEIAGTLSNVRNQHFQDEIKDGEMTFDYQLRDGTLKKSNAIELMRLVGLDV